MLLSVVRVAWPALAVAFLIAYVVHFLQVGWLFSGKTLKPKFKQFDVEGPGEDGLASQLGQGDQRRQRSARGRVVALFIRANITKIAALPSLNLTAAVSVLARSCSNSRSSRCC